MREFPDRCKRKFGSASEVKEEAKLNFNLILQIFFLISQTKRIFIKCLENMYSFMKSFQIEEIWEVDFFFLGGGWGVDF